MILDVPGVACILRRSVFGLGMRARASRRLFDGPVGVYGRPERQADPWSIQPSRDFAAKRLALVDDRNDAQGYVVMSGDTLRLSLTVVHRPPHTYDGELCFTPEVNFGSRAFACRTRFGGERSVVQMASGPADSRLNDSLFDAERDMLLQFAGRSRTITTQQAAAGEGLIRFQAELTAEIAEPDASTITIELFPDYYRSRYVPKYRLIDRKRCPRSSDRVDGMEHLL